jgi:hypothetical protein
MALTESTTTSSSNQPSSESKGDDKLEEAPPETDPSTAEILQSAVSGSDKLAEPVYGGTSSRSNLGKGHLQRIHILLS